MASWPERLATRPGVYRMFWSFFSNWKMKKSIKENLPIQPILAHNLLLLYLLRKTYCGLFDRWSTQTWKKVWFIKLSYDSWPYAGYIYGFACRYSGNIDKDILCQDAQLRRVSSYKWSRNQDQKFVSKMRMM